MSASFKKVIFHFCMVGLLLAVANISMGQSKVEQIDKLMSKYQEYGKFNGTVLVADKGKVIYKKGFGFANMEWDIPNEPDTKFRIASITKQFTGMLIMQLVAEGKLDLEGTISSYIPDYPKKTGDKITIHHLLTHSSGIPSYTAFPEYYNEISRNPQNPQEFIKKFWDLELEFTPGEKYSYNNSGYYLLGVIAEQVSGKTYAQLIQEYIFTPLEMNDSGYDHHNPIIKKRATGYGKQGNTYINSNFIDMTTPYASGSLYSTVEDLYKWDQALYTDQLLPKKYMDLYLKKHIKQRGSSFYAYGFGVANEAIGNTTDSIDIIHHNGGINGFGTRLTRATSDKSLVVLLNNTGGVAPLNKISESIRGILAGKTYDLPKKSLATHLMGVFHKKGVKALRTEFYKLKDGDTYELLEYEMNNIGYGLLRANHVEAAVEVFKLNVVAFPDSFNTYDSYGEGLMMMGEIEFAIKNYKKSVELNPDNEHGKKMIEKLKGKLNGEE